MKAKRRLRALAAGAVLTAGLVVAPNVPVVAKPTLLGSFDAGIGSIVGIAVDPVTGNLFVYPEFGTDIAEFTSAGTEVLPRIPVPGGSGNDFDLDFALEPLTVGGVTLPTNSLLAVNGESSTETLYGLNK
ncbi:MAG: hypothetical protein ACRDJI_07450, partial [Actinomycetota bacterium]